MFYDKYAELCRQRGITASAAATEAGISKSLVTKWKTNKVEVPSPDVLKKLSIYFRLPVSELLGETDASAQNKEKSTIPQDDGLMNGLTEMDKEIVKKLHLLSPDLKKEYANYLTYLLSKQEL